MVGAERCSTLAENPFSASVLRNDTVSGPDLPCFGGVNATVTSVHRDVRSGPREQLEKVIRSNFLRFQGHRR